MPLTNDTALREFIFLGLMDHPKLQSLFFLEESLEESVSGHLPGHPPRQTEHDGFNQTGLSPSHAHVLLPHSFIPCRLVLYLSCSPTDAD